MAHHDTFTQKGDAAPCIPGGCVNQPPFTEKGLFVFCTSNRKPKPTPCPGASAKVKGALKPKRAGPDPSVPRTSRTLRGPRASGCMCRRKTRSSHRSRRHGLGCRGAPHICLRTPAVPGGGKPLTPAEEDVVLRCPAAAGGSHRHPLGNCLARG